MNTKSNKRLNKHKKINKSKKSLELKFLLDNKEAIEAHNRRVDKYGAFSDGLRRF